MEQEKRKLVEDFIKEYSKILFNVDMYDLKILFKGYAKKKKYDLDLRVKSNNEVWEFLVKYYNTGKGKKTNA